MTESEQPIPTYQVHLTREKHWYLAEIRGLPANTFGESLEEVIGMAYDCAQCALEKTIGQFRLEFPQIKLELTEELEVLED